MHCNIAAPARINLGAFLFSVYEEIGRDLHAVYRADCLGYKGEATAATEPIMAIGSAFLNSSQHPPQRQEALERARMALSAGRAAEAERIAREVPKSDPGHLRALQILGCALLVQGRAAEALAPLETAARSQRDPDFDTLLAVALRRAGRPEDALSRLKRTIKRHPQHAAAFREIGSLLLAMERDDEAIDFLRRGLTVAPMAPELSIELAMPCSGAGIALARKSPSRGRWRFRPMLPRRCLASPKHIKKWGRARRPSGICGVT